MSSSRVQIIGLALLLLVAVRARAGAEQSRTYEVTPENITSLPMTFDVRVESRAQSDSRKYWISAVTRKHEYVKSLESRLEIRGPHTSVGTVAPREWPGEGVYQFELNDGYAVFSVFVVTVYYEGPVQHSEVYRFELGVFPPQM